MIEDGIASNPLVVINTADTARPATRGSAVKFVPRQSRITTILPEPAHAKKPSFSASVARLIKAINQVLYANRVEHVRLGSLIQHARVADLIVSRFGIDLHDSGARLSKIPELFVEAAKNNELKDL